MQILPSTGTPPILRIGARGSPLARIQAEQVIAQLARIHQTGIDAFPLITFSTSGDRTQAGNRPLSAFSGQGLFTREIEQALLNGNIDLAIHSAKDLATDLPPGLSMDIFPRREDVADAFLSTRHGSIADLPQGAVLGTSSVRRRAQMLRLRPDLHIVGFRGNVDTRLEKLHRGQADATLLAMAGLNRLGKAHLATCRLDPEIFPPAVAQGALGLQIRTGDDKARTLIAPLDHPPTRHCVTAERAMLKSLDGSCQTPVGVFTQLNGNCLTLKAQMLSPDGRKVFEHREEGDAAAAVQIGQRAGIRLRQKSDPRILSAPDQP